MSAPRDTRRAVGLRYDAEGADAPRVVAKGAGDVAERIEEVARAAGVPVRRDADLCELLAISDLGDEIPSEVYRAVAQLISFLWALNDELSSA
jgi:flagellar biosynthesis protein